MGRECESSMPDLPDKNLNDAACCTTCGNMTFLIFDDGLVCAGCKKWHPFEFIAPTVCETKVCDLSKLIEDG